MKGLSAGSVVSAVQHAWRVTAPVEPDIRAALDKRWIELPDHARTPAQALGQVALGCEGTHGVFPSCNLSCTPCYHSREANQVVVNGQHTLEQVDAQMQYFNEHRGPRGHAQLIGGEVSLLSPDDHAAALLAMRAHGREPMSMTNGDFDYDYLRDLVIGGDGRPRLARVSFAAHFDKLMFGRRGISRASSEAELNPYRECFAAMFTRLKREHGVSSFLAHNMTVTSDNLDELPDVIRACSGMGYRMMSFQPAAYVGDHRKWRDGYRAFSDEDVWSKVAEGAGTRLPFRALQWGDERCNRTTVGFYVGNRFFPVLDDLDPADLRARDALVRHFGGIGLSATVPAIGAVKILRLFAAHPTLILVALAWITRMVRKIGVGRLVRNPRIRPMTFVMHSFMDASQVAPAWELLERGERSADPDIRAAQERLQACGYTMAHPETGTLVPACVQHSVLDKDEVLALRRHQPLLIEAPAVRGACCA